MSRLQLVMETKGKSPYTPEVNTIDLPDTFETAWAVAEGVVAMARVNPSILFVGVVHAGWLVVDMPCTGNFDQYRQHTTIRTVFGYHPFLD
jgi:hypothetical protein